MAMNAFLKIDGIKGESKNEKRKDEIDVESWSIGAYQPTVTAGGGQGKGKASVSNFNVRHKIDRASPTLLKYCLTGKPIKEVVLTECKAGGEELAYLKYTFGDVVIAGVTSANGDEANNTTEMISLSFKTMQMEYTPQNEQGGGEGPVRVGWDVEKNTEM
ncbi:Hcp family type VI secretion system effector [Burkholderia ubonensis]|uniref:Hcp family type VI secretion system effector n=1 Tax=Burkholderia ubonensis TaxID=101571 RepID=UPI000759A38E|nr:type VI secretion system tube protein Hcp [Burkholderia ubonensis]KWB82948.1 hypothetical protein WL42_07335 [Burkholderia ubonensis]